MCWAAVKRWPNVCTVSAKMLHRVLLCVSSAVDGSTGSTGVVCHCMRVRDAIGFVYVKLCCQ